MSDISNDIPQARVVRMSQPNIVSTRDIVPPLFLAAIAHTTMVLSTRHFLPRSWRCSFGMATHRQTFLLFSGPVTCMTLALGSAKKYAVSLDENPTLDEIFWLSKAYDRGYGLRLPVSWDNRYFRPLAIGEEGCPAGLYSSIDLASTRVLGGASTREMVWRLLHSDATNGRITVRDFDTSISYLATRADFSFLRAISLIAGGFVPFAEWIIRHPPSVNAFYIFAIWSCVGCSISALNQFRGLYNFDHPEEVLAALQRLQSTGPEMFS